MRKQILITLVIVFLLTGCAQTISSKGGVGHGDESPRPSDVFHGERSSTSGSLERPQDKTDTAGVDTPTEGYDGEAAPERTEEPTVARMQDNNASPAAPEPSQTAFSQAWMAMPVVPEVSDRAREIYRRGLEMGNDPHAFSKIGDCQNISAFFLSVFENPERYTLGEEYAYLQPTIDHFQGYFGRGSLAVEGGFNVAAVLSPLRADPDQCGKNQSPLTCELRHNRPSFVIISFEEWWGEKSAETYAGYLRKIVDITISYGAVPILATKADNLEGDHSINQAIVQVAQEYDVPLWNFWRAAHRLPNHGLKEDGFHLTYKDDCDDFTDETCMDYAWAWRNLTALQALDAVRRGVASGE